MAHFAVEWVFGPDTQRRLEIRASHREYLSELHERGVLIASGPWVDNTGALLLYQVEDLVQLRQVLDADPYTQARVIAETRIHEWNIVNWATPAGH